MTLADLEVGGLKGDGLLLDQWNISGSLRIAIATISGQVSAAHASIGRGLTVTRSVFRTQRESHSALNTRQFRAPLMSQT